MAFIGVLIESENGLVKESNFGVVFAALADGANQVAAFITEGDAQKAADALSPFGVSRVISLSATGADMNQYPDTLALALAGAKEEYGLDGILGLASAKGRDVFARLAARLDKPMASDVVGIDFGAKTVRKSQFSGKTIADFQMNTDLMLATIRPNAIEPKQAPAQAETGEFAVDAGGPGKVAIVETKGSGGGKVDLTEASVIITGGRPIASKDNYQMLDECAGLMDAAVGASRASVDAGYAPHSMQVGQTGKTVSPRLYIGCGLSGSVQHFAGMKTSKIIVAVNTDKDAPIFQKCDYGIIEDMFQVVPVLTEVLREQKG